MESEVLIMNQRVCLLTVAVVSLMASFVLSVFPLDVLDEIWDLIESVSEGFLIYSLTISGQLIMTPLKRSVNNPINANYRYILIITQLKRADNSISHLIISTYLRAG